MVCDLPTPLLVTVTIGDRFNTGFNKDGSIRVDGFDPFLFCVDVTKASAYFEQRKWQRVQDE